MLLSALTVLPICALVYGAIALVSIARDDMEAAGLAALHMAAVALADIACWFAL